jgi:hypothetical protein
MDEQVRVDEIKENLVSFKTVFEEYAKEIYSDTPRHEYLDKFRTQLQLKEPQITGYILDILGDSAISVGSFGFRATISTGSLLATALLGGNNELPHNFRDFNTPVTSTLNRAIGKIETRLWPSKEISELAIGMISRLETFLNSQIEYADLLPKIRAAKRPKKELIRKVSDLRLYLLEESGKYKGVIAELTGITTNLIKDMSMETKTDRWVFAFKVNPNASSLNTLIRNIDLTKQAIGKLKADIEAGRRNNTGQPIGETTKDRDTLQIIENICNQFHTVARQLRKRHNSRPTLEVNDEYDVQDLMHGLLKLYFGDIRTEEWTPSYAGSSKKMDFLLKDQQVVIEVKKTRDNLKDREIGQQLNEDITYYKGHSDCRTLVCFVYDPEGNIGNPIGLGNDLAKRSSSDLEVKMFIQSS